MHICLLYVISRSCGSAAAHGNAATDSTSDDAEDTNEDDDSSQEGIYIQYSVLLSINIIFHKSMTDLSRA